jgi:tetratricopeptide (TPR) repeat protein
LTLNRLAARDVRDLVGQVVANNALSAEAVDRVIERTGGVPLFVEELTRAVLEKGDAKPDAHEIPATLHDSLMARLDRLGAAKEVAQIASVMGRDFTYELLRSVSSMPEGELQSSLEKLADAELIYARGIPPEADYTFKHALIQDAAYDALLKSRRRELHRRIAVAMTEKFPALAETQIEIVARHWTDAGEAEAAIAAWRKTGDAVFERHAFKEAEEAYRQALAILQTLAESRDRDTRELTLQLALGGIMVVTQGWSAVDTMAAYSRARTLAERTGEAESLQVFNGLWSSALTRGEPRMALVLADQVLDFAGRVRRPQALVIAHFEQGLTRFFLGDLAASRQYFLRVAEQYCEEDFRGIPDDHGVHSLAHRGINEWLLGYPDQALICRNDAESLARRLNKPFALVLANAAGFLTDAFRGDFERVFSASEELERLCTELGFPVHRSFCKIFTPWAHAKMGEVSGAVTQIVKGLAEFDAIEFYVWRGLFLCLLGEAQALTGAVDEALVTVERALEVNPDERLCRPEILRFHGELLLKKGHAELADRDFRDALEVARSMSAKSWELRATTSLARLLEHQGRRDEAHTELAAIYNWFTEGFDTADLKDAKALLEELNQ